MNRYRLKSRILVVLLVGLVFGSCSKDDPTDTMAPTAVISSPQENTTFLRGQSLVCNAIFEDNVELSHVEVSISNVSNLKGYDTPWVASETIELAGQKQELASYVLFNEAIPVEIMSGNYMLEFMVVDKSLNYTNYEINISIE